MGHGRDTVNRAPRDLDIGFAMLQRKQTSLNAVCKWLMSGMSPSPGWLVLNVAVSGLLPPVQVVEYMWKCAPVCGCRCRCRSAVECECRVRGLSSSRGRRSVRACASALNPSRTAYVDPAHEPNQRETQTHPPTEAGTDTDTDTIAATKNNAFHPGTEEWTGKVGERTAASGLWINMDCRRG